MGYYNDLSLGDTDGELCSDEGWHVDDRRPVRNVPQPIDTPPASDTPALDLAVTAALERLAEIEARAARQARERSQILTGKARSEARKEAAFFQRACTAYTNALIEYGHGVRPTRLPSGAWLLPSRRTGEAPHIVRMDGDWICDCKAGAMAHWPIALIIGIEVGHDDLEQFGGEAETPPPPPPPPPPTPILLSTTPAGLVLTHGDVSEVVTTPADLAGALGRLSPGTRMGQRLASARAGYSL